MKTTRRATVLIWMTIALTALMALASLAVDLGRVEVAKTELQRAADAAATADAALQSGGDAQVQAIAMAALNDADGRSVVLDPADVESGTWNGGSFSLGGAKPDAVRVTARRTAARGNAVPLLFARVLGLASCDVRANVATPASPAWSPSGNPGGIPQDYTVSSNVTLAGGTYWFTSLTVSGTLQFSASSTVNADFYYDTANASAVTGGTIALAQ